MLSKPAVKYRVRYTTVIRHTRRHASDDQKYFMNMATIIVHNFVLRPFLISSMAKELLSEGCL